MFIRSLLPTRYVGPAVAAALTACAPYPQRIHEQPVLETGAKLPAPPAGGPGAVAAASAAAVSEAPGAQSRRLADQLLKEGNDLLAANMRYQRFLNGLEIDKIKAQGEASAKMAEAIALAQQRIVVLEKQVGKP
ncbi:MAG: hypothetical protein NTW72_11785 [Gemmatimonadetes bacterium]|nr:hypothetical protein [Gemmatimonadota bacterium]